MDLFKIANQADCLTYMKTMWQKAGDPLKVGLHTKEICKRLDKAVADFDRGISTNLIISVPFRHGKALALDTPIHTTSGLKTMETVCVGDFVYNENGEPVKVIAKSEIWKDREIIDVICGSETIESDRNHLWKVNINHGRDKVKFAADIVNTNKPLFIGKERVYFKHTNKIKDTVCIQVDSDDGMFLCGETKIPTHNSDLISRFASSWFIGNHPDCDVMLVAYTSSLSEDFSRFARDLANTDTYKKIFGKNVSKQSSSVSSWKLEGSQGTVTASGLTSGITGKGYHFGVLDDYCAGRADAESATVREKTWNSFKDDFFTRKAPVAITVILATRWHVDDIIGRIKERLDPNSEKYEPNFEKFEVINFPAKDGDVFINGNEFKYDYLFPERFSPERYENMFATLGHYSASSLLQGNPTVQGGNVLATDKIHIHNDLSEFPPIRYTRVWDLAHTEKQRMKDDPDWTSGTLLAFRKVHNQWELWVKDVQHFRESAPKRDALIRATADKDGQYVQIAVENSLDSKDAINTLRQALWGRRYVKPVNLKGDKIARANPLEPIFEAGNVHILRGDWNLDWLQEVGAFPSAPHDDMVDNLSTGFAIYNKQGNVVISSVTTG